MANKSIAEKVRAREKITPEEFQKLLENVDWEAHNRRVVWALNEPRCACNNCYDSWFKWGEEVYKDMPEQFEKEKKEALIHLKNKQESIALREKSRYFPIYRYA